MGHVGIKLTAFTLVHYFLCHLVGVRPVKSGSVCFGHDGPRGRMVTTGPRVNIIEDHSTFLWHDALLADPGYTFSNNCPFITVKALDRQTICRASSSSSRSSFLRMYAMYGTVQSGVMTKTSMTKSTTAGISTSVGFVALLGCGDSSVKGSS